MKQRTKVLLTSGLLLIVLSAGFGLFSQWFTFGADSPQSVAIYFEGKKLSEEGYVIGNTPYVPVTVATKYGDLTGLSVDATNKKLNIDLSKQDIRMADDATTQFVKSYGGSVYLPLKQIGTILFVPMNTAEQFLKLSTTISTAGLKLYNYSGTDQIARINQDRTSLVPSLIGATSPDSVPLTKGEMVFIQGETDNYYQIENQDGAVGYVMKSAVSMSELDLSKIDFYAPRKEKFVQGSEKINLVWHYVYSTTPSPPETKLGGIDVLSPTWFDLIVNGDGSAENKGDLGYTRLAHDKGYFVWSTITNSMGTKGSTAFTTTVLQNQTMLKRSVAQYLFYACLYEVDGINIDYEQVVDSDRDGLTAFTAMLRTYTEKQGLTLSIDTLIPKPWTIEYDRAALARYVDYIAIMTYDEHYSSSPVAGSVASLPWVEEAVQETLRVVPKHKLLMGIPLYTRIWVVDSSGKIIRNSSATMPTINSIIKEKNLTPIWLDKEKQYFVSYPDGSYTAKIWIEDQRSIANRLNLVQSYDLAGSACWQYSQADSSIWQVFEEMLKDGASYINYE